MTASNYFKLLAMTTALVAGVLVLILAEGPAGAALPGTNGKIVFDSVLPGQSDTEITTISYNPSTGAVREDSPLTNNTASDTSPAWSPDGSKIAFESDRDNPDPFGTSGEIYVMNSDGSGERRLTFNSSPGSALDSNPTWSPDGAQLAFVSNRDGDLDIWKMNENGTNLVNLTDDNNSGASDADPAWSPDGTKIAFSRNSTIWVMNADGTQKAQLTTSNGGFPNWSPDGSRIAFQSSRPAPDTTTDSEIYTMSATDSDHDNNGDSLVLITDNTAFDEAPAWSPDGDHITFASNRKGGNFEIWATRNTVSDEASDRLTNNAGTDEYPDWQSIPVCTKRGTSGNDKLVGTTGRDVLCGGSGNDTLIGKGGNDILLGESGNDSLQGGTGNDILNGGTGTDTASYAGSATAVNASLATDFATGEGSDLLSYVERLTGSTKADKLTVADTDSSTTPASNAANVLKGLGGADTLDATDGVGNDKVDGGTGNDTCQTDAGDKKLNCP